MEVWKDVADFESYEVSSAGRIRNKLTGKVLRNYDRRGYLMAVLYKDKTRYQFGVHRLVATAFLAADEKRTLVNHKDGNRTNNHVDNLEWVTASENQLHAIRILGRKCGMIGKHHTAKSRQRIGAARIGTKLSEETKAKMRVSAKKLGESPHSKRVRNVETGEVFDCVTSAGAKYGNRRNISLCCGGKRRTANGYHWEYVNT